MPSIPRLALSSAFDEPPSDGPATFFVSPSGDLAVILAPMGRAVDVVCPRALAPFRVSRPRDDDDASAVWLLNCLVVANSAVMSTVRVQPELAGIGASIAAVLVDRTSMHVAHAGDVRVYLLRDARAERLTEDHTLASAHGEARRDAPAKIIVRAIGMQGMFVPSLRTVDVTAGDIVLLCTDAVCDAVPEAHLAMLFANQPPEHAVRELLRRATRRDTATAVALPILPPETER